MVPCFPLPLFFFFFTLSPYNPPLTQRGIEDVKRKKQLSLKGTLDNKKRKFRVSNHHAESPQILKAKNNQIKANNTIADCCHFNAEIRQDNPSDDNFITQYEKSGQNAQKGQIRGLIKNSKMPKKKKNKKREKAGKKRKKILGGQGERLSACGFGVPGYPLPGVTI